MPKRRRQCYVGRTTARWLIRRACTDPKDAAAAHCTCLAGRGRSGEIRAQLLGVDTRIQVTVLLPGMESGFEKRQPVAKRAHQET
jgi:hypothetical protein